MNELKKKTILFLSANPEDTDRKRFDEEFRELEEAWRRSKRRDQFELKSRLAVGVKEIRRALLDYNPEIVHFSGHGDTEGLKVENQKGKTHLFQKNILAELFGLNNTIECVLLNACYSETTAKTVNEHINFVIGMPQKIHDKTAIEFVTGFYDAIGAGQDYEKAFKYGRLAAESQNASQLPILFHKKKHVTLAIRSFGSYYEDLEQNVDDILCLCHLFNKRRLVKETWNNAKQEIERFLNRTTRYAERCDLYLPLHNCLAFLVGRELPFKTGIEANIYQSKPQRTLWRIPETVDLKNENLWQIKKSRKNKSGNDMAVALSVSHNIGEQVGDYVGTYLPEVSQLIHLKLDSPHHKAIKNPGHAYGLSYNAVEIIKSQKVRLKPSRLHLFIAAPNAFTFWLGQNASQLANIILYDHDDSRTEEGKKYSPTITITEVK